MDNKSNTKISNQDKKSTSEVIRQRILNLYTYLEKALSLASTVQRDVRAQAEKFWWMAEMPSAENIFVKTFETQELQEGEEEAAEQGGAWLQVQKQPIEKAPKIPEEISEWITVKPTDPTTKPVIKKSIRKKVKFKESKDRVESWKQFKKQLPLLGIPQELKDWVEEDENKDLSPIDLRIIEEKFEDNANRVELARHYIDEEWKTWSDRMLPMQQANTIYDQLYALRLLLNNEGDTYEILWGNGFLTWQVADSTSIYSPIFLTPLTIEFDPTQRTISLSPDSSAPTFCEISALDQLHKPNDLDIAKWASSFQKEPFDIWNWQAIHDQGNYLTGLLSSDAEEGFEKEVVAQPEINSRPVIHNAPVIFARKRSTELWSKYAKKIYENVESQDSVDVPFIVDLVGGRYEDLIPSEPEETLSSEEENITIPDGELYFSSPWNSEQKHIAEQLERSYGVVVKGPPGTGKSHTIANLISRFLAQGKTVLVTAQTGKALEVLRDKLPEDIRSLAVSQLGESARKDDVLQQSVAEISSNLSKRNTEFSEEKAESIKKNIKEIREKKARLINQIKRWTFLDSQHELHVEEEKITPIGAAKILAQMEEEHGWIPDKVAPDLDLPFTNTEIQELIDFWRELNKKERLLHTIWIPELNQLPNSVQAKQAFSTYRDLQEQGLAWKEFFENDSSNELFDKTTAEHALSLAKEGKKYIESFDTNWEKELFDLCVNRKEEAQQWETALSRIKQDIKEVRQSAQMILGNRISYKSSLSLPEALQAVNSLKQRCTRDGQLTTLRRIGLSSEAKELLGTTLVNEQSPSTRNDLEIIEAHLRIQRKLTEIETVWQQIFQMISDGPEFPKIQGSNMASIEVVIDSIERILVFDDHLAFLREKMDSHKKLVGFNLHKQQDLSQIIKLLKSYLVQYEKQGLELLFQGWMDQLTPPKETPSLKTVSQLRKALETRDDENWKELYEKLVTIASKQEKAQKLNDLLTRLKTHVPQWLEQFEKQFDAGEIQSAPSDLEDAWKVARFRSWLEDLHDGPTVDHLQKELERTTSQERELNTKLIAVLAWQRQIDRVKKHQRDALVTWSQAMKKYGKGTGKYAHRHLRQAQEALKDAREAVPVWIMPMQRVVQMFSDPEPGAFDVVIFDEASQCDMRGLTISYLGKKLLVVGDPEQISPAGLFQNLENNYDLIGRYLTDIPHADNFAANVSLFDIAESKLEKTIMLIEHFRCVPDIIGFSNYYCYENKMKLLRHPHPNGQLLPSLVPVFVESGYENTNNSVNEPEAEAIVEKLLACLKDEKYKKRPDGKPGTFGIISLLGKHQAKYIDDLINKHVDEQTREKHRIVCGDPYTFQGDERDVIFLSMVKAIDQNDPKKRIYALTKKEYKQRFNVAASRAKDQCFLFHSLPVEELQNPEDWRLRIMRWYYNPQAEALQAGRDALTKAFNEGKASQFSVDVGNLIIDKGYQVIPEYEVIGYRIDLVIQGQHARLAVECDGDQYHGIDQWEQDQLREQQLRRAGWEFWRLAGSSFYRHKEKALDSLWQKLEEMNIKPTHTP